MYQAASCTAEAIKKSPHEQRADVTPFSVRFGLSIYDFYQKHSDRADRFGKAMQGATTCRSQQQHPSLKNKHLLTRTLFFFS